MDERATAIVKEFERGRFKQQKYTIKLPCGHGDLEITQPRDQAVVCEQCGKTSYLVWQQKPKIQYQGA